MQRLFRLLMVTGAMILTGGCASLFPTQRATTESAWTNYAAVQLAFDHIQTNRTTVAELKRMGFDPKASPNIKMLTYVDLIQRFMPNQAIRMEDLHPAVRECILAKEHSRAFEIQLKQSYSKRHGNLLLDIFGFKRQTHEVGWEFDGLILIDDDTVVYKLSSGQPTISKDDKRVRPLGPVQELEGSLAGMMKFK
jgi:hypothetical protein